MQERLQRSLTLGAIAILVLLIGAFLWSEEALQSPRQAWETLSNALITLVGEYPDRPRTLPGQVLQLLLLLFGTFAFGALIGKFSSYFVTQALAQTLPMKSFSNHIIVCNWNAKAPLVLRQLIEANRHHPRDIVLLCAEPIELDPEFQERADVFVVQGDPTHHGTLERLNAPKAKAIILLADADMEAPDEKNALIALAVKHLEKTPGQEQDIHVVAELVNSDRQRHLKEAGVDEVISSQDYSSGIIAQSALFRQMSEVYRQLLTYSDHTNEFYFIEPGHYPVTLYGLSFPALSTWVSEYSSQHPDNPLLLVGIRRQNQQVLLNPRPTDFQSLDPTDTLIVMAYHPVYDLRG
ncbi:NAD-binding protein [Thermosynechococcus sp. HN-54]|uniref:potassium channel family protein n=1 Tax=Thermosynechococcus sp. HN-54 TaxID=2933959 RepID=UPI00202CBD0B|nr:NAD(P)-binding protein [Thermosynechococcus sp. HN-54]URR34741.1 NAD-binding protein [Thermosynechococcus sp. HN-54]